MPKKQSTGQGSKELATGELTSPSTISAAADDAMNAMLRNLKLPEQEKVEVTYTTRSGEVFTTLKPLRPQAAFVLSEAPDHPVLGVAVVGYSRFSKVSVMNIYNNHGCLVRWIVEDDPELVASAKADIAKLSLEDVKVVGTDRYSDVLNDRFVRVVIIGGPHTERHSKAHDALQACKNVLCDRPIAMSLEAIKDLFSLARQNNVIFMPMLPGRPGKAFSAVVMSLFASATSIACQRRLPDTFCTPQRQLELDDPATMMLLTDVAMQDIFAVNFSICMRPLSVEVKRISTSAHCFEVCVTYPNKCNFAIQCGLGQDDLDSQLFKLSGDSLADMRRVDHMSHVNINAHSANTSFNEVQDSADKVLRFTQEYDSARADALEQMYSMASGAKALASRVRPAQMENNVLDCVRIANAAFKSLQESTPVTITYY
mmetsp:Transcript_39098/g.63014  ORF Transcript_39098/g.63014 Transcript_39098/m.63014 type:complete len:428 (+) Transcript_39098:99-1382(+)|eukprot:CAMPEP_0179430940 /NCGR_PEP_ID=MMETSP0799-20121207/15946_1 /TAXON_ID=46947 /ORGANISM="Geminigera cryophila, Strain CCMP2564" /LENGTH=427 /DNA_ID=CAMNT_0021207605 /DNA_START=326 /DNA_END=1609 /DNA_ORIENTATION=+